MIRTIVHAWIVQMENFETFIKIECLNLLTYISGHNKYTQKIDGHYL